MKVCPRCSYVDIEGRRVCLACRGSLMGTAERELFEVLELREQVLAGGDDTVRAPWGPGLTATVEQMGRDLAAGDPPHVPPPGPPRPVRAPRGGAIEPHLRAPDAVPASLVHATMTTTTVEPPRARAMPSDVPVPVDASPALLRSAPVAPPVRTPTRPAGPARTGGGDDLAEATRRQLTDLYDARRAAAARSEGEPAHEARAPRVPRGRRARPTFGGANAVRSALAHAKQPAARRAPVAARESREASPRTRMIRRVVAVAMVLLVGFVALRAVQGGLGGDDQAVVADPSTPFDKLPWHEQTIGAVSVRVPTTPTIGAGSSYQRYTLPDIEIAIAVRPAVPSLTTDLALRTYTSQLVAQLGGRYVGGRSQGSSFGAGFSAETQIDGRRLLVYVLSTPEAVVEVQGDVLDASATRATAIFDRVVNSIEVD